jgi:D-alanine-D-alanine ligase
MRVGLVFGGRSVEHHVSIRSARTVREALVAAGHAVVCLGIDEQGRLHDSSASLRVLESGTFPNKTGSVAMSFGSWLNSGVDVIFPINHGTYGEDGRLQGFCDMLDLPFVGCGVTASALAMDKLASKRVFQQVGIPVVPYVAVSRDGDRSAAVAFCQRHDGRAFVKPSVGGSSVGCVLVKSADALNDAIDTALRFDDMALVEQAVTAREVELAVLGMSAADMKASVAGEIVAGAEFYDYADKYQKNDAKLLAPAPVSAELLAKLQSLSIAAMGAIGGHGFARIDFFVLKDESIYLNEINTLPGFTNVSMVPTLWGLSGVALPQLVDTLVTLAVARHRNQGRIQNNLQAFVDAIKS